MTPEQALLDAVRGGSEDGFRRLVDSHRAELHAHCYRMLGSLHDADDALQEALVRAWRGLPGFGGRSSLRTWLYRIAYNCFREDARRRKELVGVDEEQWQAEQDPQTVDPGLRHDLMHALNLLPLHERTAVVLCYQNGLSHDEASRVLDIPLGTVKTNVLRGREKLKRTLAAWGPN